MTTVILTNQQIELEVQITSIKNLFDIVNTYFEYQYKSISLTHNNVILDDMYPLSFYNIQNFDVILVSEKLDKYEIEEMDILLYSSPYVLINIGNYKTRALIDSGASCSVMSSSFAKSFGIINNTNTFLKSKMTGIGTASSSGVIHNIVCKINDVMITQVSFRVMESDENLLILGMDWLIKNHCKIDFIKRTIQCNDITLNFLNENDIKTYKMLVLNDTNFGENKQINEMIHYEQAIELVQTNNCTIGVED